MAGGYQYCSSCKRIEKNMTIFICPKCKRPYETVSDDSDIEDKNSNEKWYIRCGSCEEWIPLADKADIPKACPVCNDADIKNTGEDSILSEEEYLLVIGEIKSENELEENESAPNDKEEKAGSEKLDNIESDSNNQFDASESDAHKSGTGEISYIEFINNNDGKIIRIGRGKHILGKLGDVENDYFSEKRYIGRQHAMVVIDERGAFIEDWNSTNGTRINGEKIYRNQGKMRIVNEDIVTMADQNFEVRICR